MNFSDLQLELMATENLRAAGQQRPPYCARRVAQIVYPEAAIVGETLPHPVQEAIQNTEHGPIILYRRELELTDRRLAIAHAIGHLALKHLGGEPLQVGALTSHHRRLAIAREDCADRFAMAMLVPLGDLRHAATSRTDLRLGQVRYHPDRVDMLAEHFVVPAWVIIKRLNALMFRNSDKDDFVLTVSKHDNRVAPCRVAATTQRRKR